MKFHWLKYWTTAWSTVIVFTTTKMNVDAATIRGDFEISQFAADISVNELNLIETLSFNHLLNFELELNSWGFNFLLGKQQTLETAPPNSPFFETNAGNPCIIEKIIWSEDLAYFLEFEYSVRADLRFLTPIEAGAIATATSNPPLVTVSLTSIPTATVPEPTLVLGRLTVSGLGTQFKKAF